MSYTDKACDIIKQYEDLTKNIIEKNPDINLLELVAVAIGAVDYVCSIKRLEIGTKTRKKIRKDKDIGDASNIEGQFTIKN